jgi:hypothetical protein
VLAHAGVALGTSPRHLAFGAASKGSSCPGSNPAYYGATELISGRALDGEPFDFLGKELPTIGPKGKLVPSCLTTSAPIGLPKKITPSKALFSWSTGCVSTSPRHDGRTRPACRGAQRVDCRSGPVMELRESNEPATVAATQLRDDLDQSLGNERA